jgi:hypothetical protein
MRTLNTLHQPNKLTSKSSRTILRVAITIQNAYHVHLSMLEKEWNAIKSMDK